MQLKKWWGPLIAWLVKHGAELNGVDKVWTARETSNAGVGLFALERLDQEYVLFGIPPDAILFGPDRFELAEFIARYILIHDNEEEQDSEDESCNENEDEDEVNWLPFLQSWPRTKDRMPTKSVFLDQDNKDDPLVHNAVEFCPSWIVELDEMSTWLKALALVTSRLHVVWALDPYGDYEIRHALVPLADLLNGVPKYNKDASANVVCQTRRKDSHFICTTTRQVEPGEELIVQYGDDKATETDIKTTYGF